MAIGALALTLAAFIPEYRQFAHGTFPISAFLQVHSAIMVAWVLAFVAQAWFIARGRVQLHRKFGQAAFVLAVVSWLSMITVEMHSLAVHPPPATPGTFDWMLPGPYVYLTIPVLLAWGYRDRRRPDWHKRFMIIALYLSLQAAIIRYMWLPDGYGFWPFVGFLDACLLVPLFGYDFLTNARRLHPATIRGSALLVGAQALLLSLWGTTYWRHFAAIVEGAMWRQWGPGN